MRVGQLFMLGFFGPKVPEWLIRFEANYGLGGVILFDYSCQTKTYRNNIESKEQLKDLCAQIHAMPSRPLIFVDQEGGKVRRLKEALGFAPLPSQAQLATLADSKKRELLTASFKEMREVGIDFDLTPVVDLNLNSSNPNIGAIERSYSSQPNVVEENVRIVNQIACDSNLGLCLKHYPGLGGAKVDSHLELTDISESLNEDEENLFFKLAPTLSGNAILLSHGVVKQWDTKNPVSMSPSAVARIRQRLSETLLITDDLQMQGLLKHYSIGEACLQALHAGVNLLIVGNNLLGEEKGLDEIAESIKTRLVSDEHFNRNVQRSVAIIEERKKQFRL